MRCWGAASGVSEESRPVLHWSALIAAEEIAQMCHHPTIIQPSSNHHPTPSKFQPSPNHHPTIIQPPSNHHPTPSKFHPAPNHNSTTIQLNPTPSNHLLLLYWPTKYLNCTLSAFTDISSPLCAWPSSSTDLGPGVPGRPMPCSTRLLPWSPTPPSPWDPPLSYS